MADNLVCYGALWAMPVSKLRPGQRVALIKKVADHLSADSYSIIDLALAEFGLPTSDQSFGGEHQYVIEMLKGASDESLIGIAQFVQNPVDPLAAVFTTSDPPVQAKSPDGEEALPHPIWGPAGFRLFISHLATHKKFAGQLRSSLLPCAVSSFVAHSDIEPTQEWQTQIELALSTCDALVALLHPGFHDSKWTDQEIGWALGRGIPVFAVRLGEDPYGFFGKVQAFHGLKKEPPALADELFGSYCKHPRTRQTMAKCLIDWFCSSDSFATAKSRMGLVEKITCWDKTFEQRLVSALAENGQINGSWGVPDRVKSLITKWAPVAA